MSKTTAFQINLLKLIFQNIDLANIGDASGLLGSTADGNFYISLHTASPAVGGNQTTNECAYTSYARVAVVRDNTAWAVSASPPITADNISTVNFPTCTGGTETATHVGIGTDSSGSGNLLYFGALNDPLDIFNTVTPSFAAGSLNLTDI